MEIKQCLDPYFETVGLLYACAHPDLYDNQLWERAAAEYNIHAEELLQTVSPLLKKYFSAFQKASVLSPQDDYDFFFAEEDGEFILLLQFLAASHPAWFEEACVPPSEETVSLAILDVLSEDAREASATPPTPSECIDRLQASGCSPATCWKLILFLQAPKTYMQALVQLVRANLPAYEAALQAVSRPLGRRLEAFSGGGSLSDSVYQGNTVAPTLIYPTMELVHVSNAGALSYIGLFVEELCRMMEHQRTAREKLLPTLKALSDSSKFDILLSLLKSPKYNLELAEELNLTAATVSHHMNVLLNNDLVTVEKRDGRVYYTVVRETIRGVLQNLKHTFLPEEN